MKTFNSIKELKDLVPKLELDRLIKQQEKQRDDGIAAGTINGMYKAAYASDFLKNPHLYKENCKCLQCFAELFAKSLIR